MRKKETPAFDDRMLTSGTMISTAVFENAIKLARQLTEDPESAARLERHYCRSCFYRTRMAGQAFTAQDCACCGEEQTYSSNSTDILCLPCATTHDLCKHCGGDINMDSKRRTLLSPNMPDEQ
jgi:ribosomal protein S27E